MSTTLVVLGCIVGYVLVGAVYARSQAVPAYKRARKGWGYDEDTRRESVTVQLLWRTIAWPYALIFDAIRGTVRAWYFHDIDDRKQRAEQLREDARSWDRKRHTGTPAERAMAEELARICRERADELDL
jgi:hypothetical protein